MRFDTLIFDLDGTLIDGAAGLHDAAISMCAALDLARPDLATVTGFIGNGVPTLVARLLGWAEADPARQPEALAAFLRTYEADPVTGSVPYPGVCDALTELAWSGYRLALCTNKPEAPTRTILAGRDLGPFDAVVGGDTLPLRKPDPAPLRLAVERLGASMGRCLFIGDSGVDWRTAEAAEMAFALIDGGYPNGAIPDNGPRLRLPSVAALPAALIG